MTIKYCCYGMYADVGHSNDCMSRSGFFEVPQVSRCTHPEHEFPTMLHIPPGKGYRHICPRCGKATTAVAPISGDPPGMYNNWTKAEEDELLRVLGEVFGWPGGPDAPKG